MSDTPDEKCCCGSRFDLPPFDVERFFQELDERYRHATGDELVDFLRAELARARMTGGRQAVAAVANELGSVLRVRGEFEESERMFLEVLDLAEENGAVMARCNARINLGSVYVAWDKFEKAVEVLGEAEGLLPDGHPYELSAICNNRSTALRMLGRFPEARRDLRRASELLEQVPGTEGERAVNGINIAQTYLSEGRVDDAEREMAPVLEAYETLTGGRDIHRPHALATAGDIACMRGDFERGAGFYRSAAEAMADKLGEDAPAVARLREAQARAEERAAGEGSR